MPRPLLALLALPALLLAATAPAAAQAPADPGGFRNVLSVGQGQSVNTFDFARFQVDRRPPATFVNQLPHYRDLLYAAPTLSSGDLDRYFKPAGFGVPEAEIASTIAPRPGVTITRDKTYNVPHVVGVTREDVAFGVGYASAQDRLFVMDVLRSYGRSELGALAGPGRLEGNVSNDIAQFLATAYTEEELQKQIDDLPRRYGAEGAGVIADFNAFTAGVNQYIAEARLDPRKLPAEYVALNRSPRDWRPTDSVAAASLIGGIFGRGGGKEDVNGEILQALRAKLGPKARIAFDDLHGRNDPEAPVTIRKRFPYGNPGRVDRRAVAVPDGGSLKTHNPVVSGSDAAPAPRTTGAVGGRSLASNALLVTGRRSKSGRPLAVMGPQVEWYSPQILMEIDVHGPGIDARGATFPPFGYVLIGRGRDFAWSATTAQSDNVDIFAERLCSPDGGEVTTASKHYLYKGQCRRMVTRRHQYSTTTSAGSTQAPRTVVLELERTVHGNVVSRGTVNGRPVAFAEQRSTFMHEIDSAIAFRRLNSNQVTGPAGFRRAMSYVNFAFNWFYSGPKSIAFLQSGWYPRRARGTDPELPTWGTGRWDWQRFDAAENLSRRLPRSRLPQATDPRQGYMVNWNNKQAPGWRAADDNWSFGAVHRSLRLEGPLRRLLRRGGKVDVAQLVKIMALAATSDVRGYSVYPTLRAVIGRRPTGDARTDELLALLDRWSRGWAHRRDLDKDNVFDESAAVALMDAWEEPLVRAIFEPVIGERAVDRIASLNPIVDTPRFNKGSGFGQGWYGPVVKDLRRLLGRPVGGRFGLRYCGRGSQARCRSILLRTLR
ncbi:MAG TPA: penicillin acylase family protein, partial [Solirubrobacteraceae bacterium]|nr:penicillin acylase family protein [Solirubrobacteraceae bacterium]